MMLSIYVPLGVFVLLAARNPSANRSLIAFTAWSSLAHAAVMVMPSHSAGHRGELWISGALVIIGLVLVVLAPKKPSGQPVSA